MPFSGTLATCATPRKALQVNTCVHGRGTYLLIWVAKFTFQVKPGDTAMDTEGATETSPKSDSVLREMNTAKQGN